MTQTAVITGASSGIGRVTGEHLAASGFHVVNLDKAPCDSSKLETVTLDLVDERALEQCLIELSDRYEIAALINNAGFARTAGLDETTSELLKATFDLNLVAAARCARHLLPAMKRRGHGRIVNISSRSALGRELRTAYAASKGGLISMTRVWALELARHGITVNCVAPGPISTDLFDSMNPNGTDRRDKMIAAIPVGRIGTPADVARAVAFFVAPEAGFINGQTLYVCGGLSVGAADL